MNNRFLGQGLVYASVSIAPILMNFVATPFVTRILGPESYGAVAVSISLFQFGIVILTLGLAASITRQAILEESGSSGATATVLAGAGCAIGLFGFALLLLPLWGPAILHGASPGVLIYPLISCLGLAFLQNAQSFFRAEQQVASFVLLGVAASVLGPSAGLVLMLNIERTAQTYLSGLSAIHFGVGAVALALCLARQRPQFNRLEFVKSLGIGLPTIPHQMALSFLALLLVAGTSRLAGLEAAGGLQLGLLIGSAPMMLLGAVNNAWAPMIYRTPTESRGDVLWSSYRTMMLMVVVVVCGFAALAPVVVPFVAGPLAVGFPVTQVALIVALGTPFMTAYLANIHLVFISGRTSVLAVTTPISASVALLLVIISVLAGLPRDIRILALAVPLFHVFQLFMSIWIRRGRSEIEIPVLKLLPEFAVVVTLTLTGLLLADNAGPLMLLSLGLLVALTCLRRRQVAGYLRRAAVLRAG
ncbi:oligosaccharide flippase family protein [Arthrobacter sp. ISL-28]|uniref:lipopolysaccharide biosynthesis protein n=1 Tax=Arthrobacter sp. ISL-28 TaxID=2819108 RepID=UPI00288C1461|nr:oligosaccharide flippase family protein [Arthrobacter sp. ISL-28]